MMAEPLEHPLSSIVRFQSDKIKSRDDDGYSVRRGTYAAATEDGPDDAMLKRVASFYKSCRPSEGVADKCDVKTDPPTLLAGC